MLLEIGQSVLLNVEEELRLELEHAQTLLLQTEELTVLEMRPNLRSVILKRVQVGIYVFLKVSEDRLNR